MRVEFIETTTFMKSSGLQWSKYLPTTGDWATKETGLFDGLGLQEISEGSKKQKLTKELRTP